MYIKYSTFNNFIKNKRKIVTPKSLLVKISTVLMILILIAFGVIGTIFLFLKNNMGLYICEGSVLVIVVIYILIVLYDYNKNKHSLESAFHDNESMLLNNLNSELKDYCEEHKVSKKELCNFIIETYDKNKKKKDKFFNLIGIVFSVLVVPYLLSILNALIDFDNSINSILLALEFLFILFCVAVYVILIIYIRQNPLSNKNFEEEQYLELIKIISIMNDDEK